MVIFPEAFNKVTGPAHLDILRRARAIDGQVSSITKSACFYW